MTAVEQIESNSDYYDATTIELCVISYESQDKISAAVASNTNLKVVWGPARLVHWDDIAYSLMYVACNAQTGEYFVVIRGTNFDSLSSWLNQDFAVGTTQPFARLPDNPPNVPADALISQGTFNGMSDLISLKDPSTQKSVVDFLQAEQPRYLYVTGHSLGGTLTPSFAAYLNAMLYKGAVNSNMGMWSFAGLTAGGNGFNNYFNGMFPDVQKRFRRFHNDLDIAPFCWYSKSSIQNIYRAHDLQWSYIEEYLIGHYFSDAEGSGISYAQPIHGITLNGQFDKHIIEDYSWAAQALHQHHSTTYQRLIIAFLSKD